MTLAPQIRARSLDLSTLRRFATEFDAISSEDGQTRPATEFVTWLRHEWEATLATEGAAARSTRREKGRAAR